MNTESSKNMSLWAEAEATLRKLVVERWNPLFGMVGSEDYYYNVCDEEDVLSAAPREILDELEELFIEAKEKLLLEVGFNLEYYNTQVINKELVQAMNEDLSKKISVYEESCHGQVKDMFFNMLLHSEWKV